MPPFEVSLSESLLLGLCVEEHARLQGLLFSALERYLRPFVPLLTQTRWVPVSPDDVPSDVEWYVLTPIEQVRETVSPESHHDGTLDPKVAEIIERIREDLRQNPPPPTFEHHFLPANSTPLEDDAFCLGRSHSWPRSVFLGNICQDSSLPGCPTDKAAEGTVLRMFWDKSRRSLVELVLDHVQRSCGTSSNELVERRGVPGPERWLWDFANYLEAKLHVPLIAPNFVTPREDDLPWWSFCDEGGERIFGLTDRLDLVEPDGWETDHVCQAIEQVVTANGHDEIFGVGREFARLICACNRFDAEFEILARASDPNDPQGDGLEAERRTDDAHFEVAERCQHVLGLSVVRRCHHASAILAHELSKRRLAGRPSVVAYNRLHQEGGPVPIYGDDDAFESEVRAYFERWSHASAAAWLAFGDVVGVLREVDRATLGKDRSLPSLRAFQLRADSSSDAVRAAICLAERELADERNPDHQPKNIVASISHGIEALTKRLWAKDFPTDRDGRRGLLTVLSEKQRSEDALEARFGAVARTLYITYRNPICHDFDAYNCTWADARFFVAGMRLLFDISEQLVQQRRN